METTTKSTKTGANSTKKGNKTTELIIGTAAAKLTAGISNLQATMEAIGQLGEKAHQNTLILLEQEDKLGQLDQELANKKAQNKYEIELSYKTDKETFVNEYLKENNLSAIKDAEWLEMQERLQKADTNLEAAVKKEVAIVSNSLTSKHNSELQIKQLEHEKKEAANAAEINQLKNQNKFLEEQLNHWKTMLENQVKAETERAKHGAINTLNVGGTTQGR